jgi:hypothetical protein
MSVIKRTTSTVDSAGNVQKTEVTLVNRLPKEPEFVKLYTNNLHLLTGLHHRDIMILNHLIVQMGYDGILNLNSTIKRDICIRVELFQRDGKGAGRELLRDGDDNPIPSLNGFNMSLVRLQQRMVLIRMGQSQYMVNPFLYAKGLWSDVKKLQQKVSHLFNIKEEDKV